MVQQTFSITLHTVAFWCKTKGLAACAYSARGSASSAVARSKAHVARRIRRIVSAVAAAA